MTNQITRDELLDLIFVEKGAGGGWYISGVKTDVYGKVQGDVYGDIGGDVCGNVTGNVRGNVFGDVDGTINGREWDFVETPTEKLQRLVTEGATKEELLLAIDQLEDN
ncbi:MAG: hypothetical protein GY904_08410 [Planctomycetaceae bacterium]|jgi:hypothetical protein|nr:hypothetical protein [Planctomycetaceae bacterium]